MNLDEPIMFIQCGEKIHVIVISAIGNTNLANFHPSPPDVPPDLPSSQYDYLV